MTVSRRRGLTVAIASLTIASVHSVASAAAPPTAPPDGEPAAIPADFVPLIDDTGTITVQVPGSWGDVDTAQDGVFPSIEASTDLEAYHNTFDVAGVSYRAVPFNADTEERARAYSTKGGCVNEELVPYGDGVFSGTRIVLTGCGGPTSMAELHVIAANPADQSFTAQLRIQITGPADYPILEGILATFNAASGSGSAGSTTPTTSTEAAAPMTVTATGAFPQPSGSVPADWTGLLDDTQTISIRVPSEWAQTHTVPAENADGTPRPWISATTDQESFFPPAGTADTFSVPGVVYQAAPFVADTASELAASVYHEQCTADPVQTYDDGAFSGHIQFFVNCGGTASRIVQVAANPADGSFTALVLVQLTGQPDDVATLDGLLSSFNRVTGAGAPTTAVVASTDAASPDSAVGVLQQQLEEQLGLVITDEQGSCLVDNFGDTDPNDVQAVLALLTTCGVDFSDVTGG